MSKEIFDNIFGEQKPEEPVKPNGFTPGPWRNRCPMIYGAKGIGHTDVAFVKEVYMNRREREANAALISASPELYEALMACYAHLEFQHKGEDFKDLRQMVSNALDKARGEGNESA